MIVPPATSDKVRRHNQLMLQMTAKLVETETVLWNSCFHLKSGNSSLILCTLLSMM